MKDDPAGEREAWNHGETHSLTSPPMSAPFDWSVIKRDLFKNWGGLLLATLVLVAIEGFGISNIGWKLLALTVGVMAVAQTIGVAFQHFPSGHELVLFRAGMVAICRTLLPLVLFAMMAYNGRFQPGPAWGLAVVGLYLVPLLCTLVPVLRESISQ